MAKKQNRIAELRKDVDQLRKSYTKAMSSANKAVYKGIERLADHELAAIKKHYEEALKNLRKLRKGGDARDIATEQLRLLQDTIDRIMKNARESMKILDDTRKQIAADIRKSLDDSKKPAAKKAKTTRKTAKKTAGAKKTTRKKTAKKAPAKRTTTRKSSAAKTAKKPTAKKTPAKKPAAARKKTATRKKTAG